MPDESRKYRIIELLGVGGFGRVYRAELTSSGGFSKAVALKVLNPDMEDIGEVAGRLRDEARILGLLRHRAIVQVDGLLKLEGRWTVVMEFVDGVDLRSVVNADLPLGCALDIVAEVASALNAAFNQPGTGGSTLKLLHRDIKPANIQLTAGGDVKVLDFGIARAEFKNREAETRSISMGTPEYMSPERQDFTDSHAGDVYAVGAVLYELVVGKRLMMTSAAEKRHIKVLTHAAEMLDARRIDPEVKALILSTLTYEPDERPTARDFERRARTLRSRYPEPLLADWCEDNIPARKQQREVESDPLVGDTLAEDAPSTVRPAPPRVGGQKPPPSPDATFQRPAVRPRAEREPEPAPEPAAAPPPPPPPKPGVGRGVMLAAAGGVGLLAAGALALVVVLVAVVAIAWTQMAPPPPEVATEDGDDGGDGDEVRAPNSKDATSGKFGFDGDLSSTLATQACDEEAEKAAEEKAKSGVEAEATKVREEATATWVKLKPQLEACQKLEDHTDCVKAATEFVAASKAAKVDMAASVETVQTRCGERTRALEARSLPVEIAEVIEAEAFLARLAGPKGDPAAEADWESPTLGTLKWIAPGAFTMGSPKGEADRGADETQHQVTLTRGFQIMDHEVTQAQWQAVMGSNPSRFASCGETCPVDRVSWDDAHKFAEKASALDGVTYRLPTEAEWEYAARGGTSTIYAGGRDADSVGWVASNSATKTHPVCEKARNGYGLCDMSGNVWEWVEDGYGDYGGAASDPTGPESATARVYRGGAWGYEVTDARVANRGSEAPGARNNRVGLRLVRSVP